MCFSRWIHDSCPYSLAGEVPVPSLLTSETGVLTCTGAAFPSLRPKEMSDVLPLQHSSFHVLTVEMVENGGGGGGGPEICLTHVSWMQHCFPTKANLGHRLLIEPLKTTNSAVICGFMLELSRSSPWVKLENVSVWAAAGDWGVCLA